MLRGVLYLIEGHFFEHCIHVFICEVFPVNVQRAAGKLPYRAHHKLCVWGGGGDDCQ